jgi:hypothetical protein
MIAFTNPNATQQSVARNAMTDGDTSSVTTSAGSRTWVGIHFETCCSVTRTQALPSGILYLIATCLHMHSEAGYVWLSELLTGENSDHARV